MNLETRLECIRVLNLAKAKQKEQREGEVTKAAEKTFQKGFISGMDLGIIAHKNNNHAF